MAFSLKICRCRLDLHSLLHTTNRATGNLQRRNAVRWGWMKTRAAQKSDAALQSLVDFCCANIADNQDRLGAASEAELIRLLGALQASGSTVQVLMQNMKDYY